MTTGTSISRVVSILLLVCACAAGLSCASSDQLKAISSKTDDTRTLAVDIQRDQKQIKKDMELLRAKIDEMEKVLRTTHAGTAEDTKQLTQSLNELLVKLSDVAVQQESLRSAVLDLEEAVGRLSAKKSKRAKSKSPKSVFAAARRDYNRGDYDAAIMGFKNFLAVYPKSTLADDARYWLAESFFATQNARVAITEFMELLKKFPRSDWVPESMLRLGLCHKRIDEPRRAREFWDKLIKRFPDSNEARLAEGELDKLKVK
ncbi:tol-pal system protein YbgF [bacterium]|nr:tol-pal system protein YbgF [bacterium]